MSGISRHIAITCPLGILSSVFSDKSTKSAHVKLPVWPQETQKPQQTQEILNFETLYKNFEFCTLTSEERILGSTNSGHRKSKIPSKRAEKRYLSLEGQITLIKASLANVFFFK